jgi:ferritin
MQSVHRQDGINHMDKMKEYLNRTKYSPQLKEDIGKDEMNK